MESTKRRTPAGLDKAGRALFRSVADNYGLEQHEMQILTECARIADRLDAIDAALVGAPLTVANRFGDQVANSLLVESRQQAMALARLLATLRIPTGDEDVQPQRRGGARGISAK